MHTYMITGSQHCSEVRRWSETTKRRACRLARVIAEAYGTTLDDVYVTDVAGATVYHLRRSPEGDGACWYQATV